MPRTTILHVPSPSLVVMVGAAGSGKSTFCRRSFRPAEIVGTDACRALLAGDEADQGVSPEAFALAHRMTEERLRRGLLTVFDATSVDARARKPLLAMAARRRVPAVAIVMDLPVGTCLAHDRKRSCRVGRAVIVDQARRLSGGLPRLRAEGFAAVHVVSAAGAARRTRVSPSPPAPCVRHDEEGPFDIIGDIHGCADELMRLLMRLGYRRASPRGPYRHPRGRRAVFVGDLVDRGPQVVRAARIVMRMTAVGSAFCVPGNHEVALLGSLYDGARRVSPGTSITIRQIEALPAGARRRFLVEFEGFLLRLPSHLVLDGGRLAVAHAGITHKHLGRTTEEARRFAIFGQTTGERDRFGLPVRVTWAAGYRGKALVVYGHTPVREPEWIRNTVNIDTGCVYGGKLTALRYPEQTIVSVVARRAYYRPRRSLPAGVGLRAQTRALPVEGVVSDRPALPETRSRQAQHPSAPPRRSPPAPPGWPPSPSSWPPVSLARRTGPSTE
jgi:protein phosphatase